MRTLLLISDTNVLIDVEVGNLTPVIFHLPYEIAVPDVLFDIELKERHSHLLQAGLKVKSLTAESVKRAEGLGSKYPRPSIIDHLALTLALQEQCPLLTGDKDLRAAAIGKRVEVHGTLWIVEQRLQAKLIEQAQARSSFDSMNKKGSRLPWGDAEKLIAKWEAVGTKNE